VAHNLQGVLMISCSRQLIKLIAVLCNDICQQAAKTSKLDLKHSACAKSELYTEVLAFDDGVKLDGLSFVCTESKCF